MSLPLLAFQERMCGALVRRLRLLKAQYDEVPANRPEMADTLRLAEGATLLQAPTGVGKTLLAVEVVRAFSAAENIIWFWFVPFTGLIRQAQNTFRAQAPAQKLLTLDADRSAEALRNGGVYVISWQSVAASRADTRVVRQTRDEGLSIDALIQTARDLGYRIGCVVDEAHHGFKKARESTAFFANVLRPDYALLMTATPRDEDALTFSERTGYQLGAPDRWPTVSREEGVAAGLLKANVKTVRFLAAPGMESRMLDFERLALRQASALHRLIKQELVPIGVTPLLLVQVPNGAEAAREAEAVLIREQGFLPEQIRTHTSDEPDEGLASIANDNSVEVLIFKIAVATGFDAPRAFTLAALRGVRDPSFGVQVVGRIMRVHRLLQGRKTLSPLLSSGYVFLANEADQEGLHDAADLINELRSREPATGPQTMLTVRVDEAGTSVDVIADGAQFALTHPSGEFPAFTSSVSETNEGPSIGVNETAQELAEAAQAIGKELESSTPNSPGPGSPPGTPPDAETDTDAAISANLDGLTRAIAQGALSGERRYPLRDGTITELRSESLPSLPDDFEERLVASIDFSQVLADRDRENARVTQRTEGLFEEDQPLDERVLARLSAPIIAERAKQITLAFEDIDQRHFLRLLEDRFKTALQNAGIDVPDDPETLRRQLDLVLVRNPRLVREAHRRVRSTLISIVPVHLPSELVSPVRLPRATKNLYGVFPPGMGTDENQFARSLDCSDEVLWWHRNEPSRNPAHPESVGLWGWSGGVAGFYPDFVVAVQGRSETLGPALAEIKGMHLQEADKAKAGARHLTYGRVFVVGKRSRDDERFWYFRLENNALTPDGVFDPARMKFDL